MITKHCPKGAPIKIAILTQYFAPEIGAPQARLLSLAKSLIKAGHQVAVLTAMPNYPKGKIYEGYGGIYKRESKDGIEIIRTFIYATKSPGKIPRLTQYFSFVLSAIFLGGALLQKADYLITESPPLFLGIAGYILSRLKKARWIFNVSDLWPESAVSLRVIKRGLFFDLAARLEAFCYKKASLVSCQSNEIKENIQSRFPHVQTYLFSNGVNSSQFHLNENHHSPNVCKVLYVGLHGLAQGLDQIILAAEKIRNISMEIIFVGDGPEKEKLIKLAKDKKIFNIEFKEPIPHDSVPALLTSSDIILVPLKSYIPGAVPSKLYEAMAAGRSVLFVGEGEGADIVLRHHCGLVVRPGNIDGLADALARLAQNPETRNFLGIAGRNAAIEFFDRPAIEKKFIELLEHLP